MAKVISVRKKDLKKQGYNDLNDWLNDSNHVYIGRSNRFVDGTFTSKWHNPYSANKYGRDGCIKLFKKYLLDSHLIDDIHELKGKDLGCWCYPMKCHGDILLKLANEG